MSAAVLVAVLACDMVDDVLEVEAPSQVIARELDDPKYAALLVNGAVADFECAFAHYTLGAGIFGDELADAQLFGQMWDYDRRSFSPEGIYGRVSCDDGTAGIYTPLSIARFVADDVLRKLEAWTDAQVPNRTRLIAQAANLAGYALVLLGEGMCSAAIDGGPELTRQQVHAEAEQRFSRGLESAQAAGDAGLVNLARVGRARARLNLGEKATAAADARLVPEGFAYNATYSAAPTRRHNVIYRANIRDGSFTVEDDFRDLDFGGVPDARVPVRDAGRVGVDGLTPLWTQQKYTTLDAPIPIARWEEARLILAESELSADPAAAVDIINDLHARAGLPPYEGGTSSEVMQHLIQERHRELFLESHYLGDVQRYGITLTPVAGTDFPPKGGGRYGDQTCFPLPARERLNNPNIPSP